MRRSDQERRRLAAASALRNAHRLLNLSDNPLVDEAGVRALAAERYPGAVMAEELALSDLIVQSGREVLEVLRGDQRFAREATVLETVLSTGSVARAAKQLSLSREHLSNTAWRSVSRWVLDDFERRMGASRARPPVSKTLDDPARPLPLHRWKTPDGQGGDERQTFTH